MEKQNLDQMTKQQHSHTPYLVILYKVLQKWKSLNNDTAPKNSKEKRAFKELIKEGKP